MDRSGQIKGLRCHGILRADRRLPQRAAEVDRTRAPAAPVEDVSPHILRFGQVDTIRHLVPRRTAPAPEALWRTNDVGPVYSNTPLFDVSHGP
jgi:hypothetical protein